MSKLVVYKMYHWWEGDRVSSPGWVRTATNENLRSIEEVKDVLQQMRAHGWTEFRVFKHTLESIDPNTLCLSESAKIPTAPKRNGRKHSVASKQK